MQVQTLKMPRGKAYELYKAYKTHQAYQTPEDYEIMRTYKLIAQGRVVIQALESVRLAGLNEKGLPKLAICRADQKWCHIVMGTRGNVIFYGDFKHRRLNSRIPIGTNNGFFPSRERNINTWDNCKAAVPIIPPQYRPKRGIENYHVLWEAEWEKVPPVDPYLLRRIGKNDMWLVVAAWNLTPVE